MVKDGRVERLEKREGDLIALLRRAERMAQTFEQQAQAASREAGSYETRLFLCRRELLELKTGEKS